MNAKPKIAVQLYSVHKYIDAVGLEKTLADVVQKLCLNNMVVS